jgi:hypothetical protein
VFADGEHAMKTALQELEEAGHLQRVLGNRSTGFDHQWVVYEDLVECPNTACSTEEPIGRFSASGESTSEEPISGKPPSIKKNNSKKNNSKKTTREGGVAPTAADLVEMRQMLNDVDWDRQALVLWRSGESGSCPETLVDVDVVDGAVRVATERDTGPNMACTDDYNPYRMVAAVDRDRLPDADALPADLDGVPDGQARAWP